MAYKIIYIPEALKQLSKLDKTVAKNIIYIYERQGRGSNQLWQSIKKGFKGLLET